jgi:hypothetical protein
MQGEIIKTLASSNGNTYILRPSKQTTEEDIISIHNLIAQLLVDDYNEYEGTT